MYAGILNVPSSIRTENIKISAQGQTIFTGLNYNPAVIEVFVNGRKLIPGIEYTAGDGSILTLSTPVNLDDVLDIISNTEVIGAAVTSVAGKSGSVSLIVSDVAGAAPIDSPVLTGNPKAPTPLEGDNDTSIATTAFVQTELTNHYPRLDGTGKIPTTLLPASVLGSLIYQGTWDATNNVPALTSGVGEKGHYYKVSVTGTTTLDGIAQWYVGDVVVFNGTTWDRLDGSPGEVLSVAGKTGQVTLNVADVSGAAPLASPAFTGNPTAPTPAASDNDTTIATTAFVKSSIGTLGVQNSNAVSISGGTITASLNGTFAGESNWGYTSGAVDWRTVYGTRYLGAGTPAAGVGAVGDIWYEY